MNYPSESASRLPGWTPGVPAVLANGEVWHIPRAAVGPAMPAEGGGYEVSWLVGGRDSSEEFDEAMRLLGSAMGREDEDGDEAGLHVAYRITMLAAMALRHNYRVSAVDACLLLRYGFEAAGDFRGAHHAIQATNRAIDFGSIQRRIAGLARDPETN